MKKKRVTITIEASATGFGAYSDDLPGVTSYGESIDEAKEGIVTAVQELFESYADGEAPKFLNNGNLEYLYQYDFPSLFSHFPLDTTAFAKRIELNASLLRRYKTKKSAVSVKQKKKIEAGLHELGRELLSVRL